jgi:hypothetical protein
LGTRQKIRRFKMSNLKTILEELISGDEMVTKSTAPNGEEFEYRVGVFELEERIKTAVAKIEGMIPEERWVGGQVEPPDLSGKPNSDWNQGELARVNSANMSQGFVSGYNQAIEDFRANLGGKYG